jgi:hypothetical protein
MLYESNWHVAATYSYLDNLGAMAFAWEYLRRNSAYQDAYKLIASNDDAAPETSEQMAQQWGLHFMADPGLRADLAHIVWLPHLNPATVVVAPAPHEFPDARPIEMTPAFSHRLANGEHWFLDQGGDALPVALIGGADAVRPAAIMSPPDSNFAMRMEAAYCLHNAMSCGTPGRAPGALTAQQRHRLRLILRALDGKSAKYSEREIAIVLFGPNSVPSGSAWYDCPERGQTRRLCGRGKEPMNGGYHKLLRSPRRFRS